MAAAAAAANLKVQYSLVCTCGKAFTKKAGEFFSVEQREELRQRLFQHSQSAEDHAPMEWEEIRALKITAWSADGHRELSHDVDAFPVDDIEATPTLVSTTLPNSLEQRVTEMEHMILNIAGVFRNMSDSLEQHVRRPSRSRSPRRR